MFGLSQSKEVGTADYKCGVANVIFGGDFKYLVRLDNVSPIKCIVKSLNTVT